MGQIIIETKRPTEATPERALALSQAGVTPLEMAKMWGVSRPLIYYLLGRARKAAAKNAPPEALPQIGDFESSGSGDTPRPSSPPDAPETPPPG